MSNDDQMRARPTVYKGVKMRSRLEARVASMFDHSHLQWTFEPHCFADETGEYLPDFEVRSSTGRAFIEVKPTKEMAKAALEQMRVIWSSEPDVDLFAIYKTECPYEGIGLAVTSTDIAPPARVADPVDDWVAHLTTLGHENVTSDGHIVSFVEGGGPMGKGRIMDRSLVHLFVHPDWWSADFCLKLDEQASPSPELRAEVEHWLTREGWLLLVGQRAPWPKMLEVDADLVVTDHYHSQAWLMGGIDGHLSMATSAYRYRGGR